MNRILILGGTGMLGNTLFRLLATRDDKHEVWAAVRSGANSQLPRSLSSKVVDGLDATQIDSLTKIIADLRPNCIINCIGLVKQHAKANDPLLALPINSIFPHSLARVCAIAGARLIHISTDCVFSGSRGYYVETDEPDPKDLYGRSKLLGEVAYPHTITLRTSIIGHELSGAQGLVGWFMSQQGRVTGYKRAVFSGLPTVELAVIIRDFVIPRSDLSGVFHVASQPIAKYELLKIIAKEYGLATEIVPDDTVQIDRSLCAAKFDSLTGYKAPPWPELVKRMHAFR